MSSRMVAKPHHMRCVAPLHPGREGTTSCRRGAGAGSVHCHWPPLRTHSSHAQHTNAKAYSNDI